MGGGGRPVTWWTNKIPTMTWVPGLPQNGACQILGIQNAVKQKWQSFAGKERMLGFQAWTDMGGGEKKEGGRK